MDLSLVGKQIGKVFVVIVPCKNLRVSANFPLSAYNLSRTT